MAEAESHLAALLPNSVDGWEVSADDRVYDRGNLYDYIDGGAELYLSFGLTNVLSRTYSKPGQPDIVVDLFDMGVSPDAFGAFSLSCETVDTTFGQGSQYTRGLLLFWKNSYFVSILARLETDESKSAIFGLARSIEAAIAENGPLPEILSLLPPQSLVRESVRYFRHHIWQNSHYFISTENILHIGEKTDALVAKYGEPRERYILLLVGYENQVDAELGYNDFVRHYLPELSEKPVVQIEDGTWAGCQVTDDLLIAVLSAPTGRAALGLMEAVQEKRVSK